MGSGHFSGTTWSWERVESILRHIEVLNGHQDSIWLVRETLATSPTACSGPRQDGEGQEKSLSALMWRYSLLLRILVAKDGVQRVMLHSMHFRESFENEYMLTSNTSLDLMS